MILSHPEHTRKCLKVEYLGRIEYDFRKSLVTGPWDHKDSVSAKKYIKKFHACVPLSVIPVRARLLTDFKFATVSSVEVFLTPVETVCVFSGPGLS